jgi:hypothetical protein
MFTRFSLLAAGLTAAVLSLAPAAEPAGKSSPPPAASKFVVHEWGTFLGVQGSDGSTLGGMVASEEVLPPFVEARSFSTWDRVTLKSKMETPVTYFYTDRPLTVDVKVDMPRGILTHWFPMVYDFRPPVERNSVASPTTVSSAPQGSYLYWQKVELIPHMNHAIPAGQPVPTLWRVKAGDPWKFARETDAAIVKVRSRNMMDWSEWDYEKFLFYRGLGSFDLPLQVKSAESGSDTVLTLHNGDPKPLTGLFAIWVDGEDVRFGPLGELAGRATRNVSLKSALNVTTPLSQGLHPIMKPVAEALMAAGLYEKEAWAMVYSWEKSYFRTSGLRVLYILPRATVDSYIPIQIAPPPQELVRVMVGRTEVLTPAQERQIEHWVADLGSPDFKTRDAASTGLAKLGRLSEPALRRVAAITDSAEVRNRATDLIKTAMRQ